MSAPDALAYGWTLRPSMLSTLLAPERNHKGQNGMESGWGTPLIIGGITLIWNIGMHFFGGGWLLSARLASMETSMKKIDSQLDELSDVLVTMAEMRGDYRALDQRISRLEGDLRDLRRGHGFIRGPHGVDREYGGEG